MIRYRSVIDLGWYERVTWGVDTFLNPGLEQRSRITDYLYHIEGPKRQDYRFHSKHFSVPQSPLLNNFVCI